MTLAGGPQRVEGVAVFGERIDNDGVIDADVQVEEPAGFRTVTEIRNATSPAWIVRFPPVPASKVRLVVLRSGGPTDHTDVYEIEVLGAPLTEAELAARIAGACESLRLEIEAARRDFEAAGAAPVQWRQSLETLGRRRESLEIERGRWGELSLAARAQTVSQVDHCTLAVTRLRTRLAQHRSANPRRREGIERAMAEARDLIRNPPALEDAERTRTVLTTPEVAWCLEDRKSVV